MMDPEGRWTDSDLQRMVYNGIAEGECQSCGDYTECEPDATANYCPSCRAYAVVSALVLLEIM